MFAATDAMRFALDVTLKVTLLLLIALMVRLMRRRASAAGRHAWTTLALAGAALLPLFSPLLPRWEIPLLANPFPKARIERHAALVTVQSPARWKQEDFRRFPGPAPARSAKRSAPA